MSLKKLLTTNFRVDVVDYDPRSMELKPNGFLVGPFDITFHAAFMEVRTKTGRLRVIPDCSNKIFIEAEKP